MKRRQENLTLEATLRKAMTCYNDENEAARRLLINRLERLLDATRFVGNKQLNERDQRTVNSFLKLVVG